MIHEPTSWSADCDAQGCDQRWFPDWDAEDLEEVRQGLRLDGWVVVGAPATVLTFCSLGCWSAYRAARERARERVRRATV